MFHTISNVSATVHQILLNTIESIVHNTVKVGAAKDLGAAIGVAINGINIQVKSIKGRSSS